MSTKTEPSILSADEILKKKEELKHENSTPKTNGDLNGHSDSMETCENEISDKNGAVSNGNAENGETSKGKTVNGESLNSESKNGESQNGESNNDESKNGEIENDETKNGDHKTDGKSSEISKQVDANIELAQNSVQEAIKLKRKRIQEVAEKLANEEARYTVLKKIRLSQLSTENAAKEAQEAVEASHHKMEDKNNKSEIHNISSASSAKDNNKFKPIQPASIKTLSGKNTPVLSPTPKLRGASPGFDSPKNKNGKKTEFKRSRRRSSVGAFSGEQSKNVRERCESRENAGFQETVEQNSPAMRSSATRATWHYFLPEQQFCWFCEFGGFGASRDPHQSDER